MVWPVYYIHIDFTTDTHTVDPSSNAVNDVANDSTAAIYSMVPVFLHKYLKARTRNETIVKGIYADVNSSFRVHALNGTTHSRTYAREPTHSPHERHPPPESRPAVPPAQLQRDAARHTTLQRAADGAERGPIRAAGERLSDHCGAGAHAHHIPAASDCQSGAGAAHREYAADILARLLRRGHQRPGAEH